MNHPSSQEQLLGLQTEIQSLRLELSERDREIQRISDDLERLQQFQSEAIDEHLAGRLQAFFSELALPLIQIQTQMYLSEVAGKTVQPRDIFASLRRLLKILEEQGLQPVGETGQVEPFDPDRHASLSGAVFNLSEPVKIRLVGMQYQGKILRKANVEKAEV